MPIFSNYSHIHPNIYTFTHTHTNTWYRVIWYISMKEMEEIRWCENIFYVRYGFEILISMYFVYGLCVMFFYNEYIFWLKIDFYFICRNILLVLLFSFAHTAFQYRVGYEYLIFYISSFAGNVFWVTFYVHIVIRGYSIYRQKLTMYASVYIQICVHIEKIIIYSFMLKMDLKLG